MLCMTMQCLLICMIMSEIDLKWCLCSTYFRVNQILSENQSLKNWCKPCNL
jgi:hypothetical protein